MCPLLHKRINEAGVILRLQDGYDTAVGVVVVLKEPEVRLHFLPRLQVHPHRVRDREPLLCPPS